MEMKEDHTVRKVPVFVSSKTWIEDTRCFGWQKNGKKVREEDLTHLAESWKDKYIHK